MIYIKHLYTLLRIRQVILVLSALLIGSGSLVQAQTQQDINNLEKYWSYKDRLLGNGTKNNPGHIWLGTGPGESIPWVILYPDQSCNGWLFNGPGTCNFHGTVPGKSGIIEFGADATSHLGFYIATLSTEYALLKKANQSTEATTRELFLALHAFDRLDKFGEEKYGLTGELDGWFTRDDAPEGFQNRFSGPGTYNCTKSGGVCRPGQEGGNMASQDQIVYLLMGFALVEQYIPDNLTYNHQGTEVNLLDKAKNASERIITNLRKNDWKLIQPTGTPVPAEKGGSAFGFSFAFAKAAKFVSHKRFQNGGSSTVSHLLWNFVTPGGPIISNEVNKSMVLCLAAQTDTRNFHQFKSWCIFNDMQIYALLRAALHPEKGYKMGRSLFQDIIDQAPMTGPCDNTPGCEMKPGWRGTNRWLHPDNKDGKDEGGLKMQTYGIDYMLLYNLFHLYYGDELPVYQKIVASKN